MPSYRAFTLLIAPLLPLWLRIRQWRGKEDPARLKERFGIASQPRPKVARDVEWLVLDLLAERTRRRLKLERT